MSFQPRLVELTTERHSPGQSSVRASMPLFLRVKQAADILGVDPRSVRHGIEAGEIPHVRVSTNTIRIPTRAFLAWAQIDPEALNS